MEEHRAMQEVRGNISQELHQIATKALVDTELESLTLFRLLRAFETVMDRFGTAPPKAVHQIIRFNYSIEGQQEFIYSRVSDGRRADFKAIFGECQDRIHAIITFLALLDLVNLHKIQVLQGEGVNNFWLQEAPAEDQISEWLEEEE
jgi:segregation and condensation protein A